MKLLLVAIIAFLAGYMVAVGDKYGIDNVHQLIERSYELGCNVSKKNSTIDCSELARTFVSVFKREEEKEK